MAKRLKAVTEWFSAAQAARHSGLSAAMVNYLCREGIVEPSLGSQRGHGVRRQYCFGDLVALRLVARLSAAGVSVLRLKKAMLRLSKVHPEITLTSLPASHIVTDGQDVYLHQGAKPLERAFDGQFAFAFVVELAHIQREVARSVSDQKPPGRPRGMAA